MPRWCCDPADVAQVCDNRLSGLGERLAKSRGTLDGGVIWADYGYGERL